MDWLRLWTNTFVNCQDYDSGNLIVPFTLRIHPDTNCEVDGNSVEIGIAAARGEINRFTEQDKQSCGIFV